MAFLPRIAILAAAACLCGAQSLAPSAPRVGSIDIFGLRKVQESKIRQALGVREGDPLPPSKGNVEERVSTVDGVVESHLEAVCCDEGRIILYVGIEERGVPHFEIRDFPEGEATLPIEVSGTYRRLMEASDAAVRRGSTAEDRTRGHTLMADPAVRAVQDMLPSLADEHLVALRKVLRESSDDVQRAAAAEVIGYTTKKAEVVNDLQLALRDADAGVRSNAARGLVALSVLQRLQPESGVKVSPTWFIEMLNSLSWTDRNKAVAALQLLTDNREAGVITQLRDRALPSLVEMARWKAPAHAIGSFVLLGRVAGLTEEQIQDAWSRGDREAVIAAASKK